MSLNFLEYFSSRRAKKLEEALDQYEKTPGEAQTLKVVQLFLKARDYKQAFMYADNGYQRFPTSKGLLKVRQASMRRMALEECRDLEKKVAASPRPETAAKMLEIRRSLNDFKACERVSRRWGRRFPKSWVLQFSIAKYLFQRSLVEKDPRVSARCLEQLEHAVSLKPDNYKTLLYLATLLQQLGKTSAALNIAEKLSKLYPKDSRASSLVGYIRKAARGDTRTEDATAEVGDIREIAEQLFADLREDEAVLAIVMEYSDPSAEGEDPTPCVSTYFSEETELNFERGEETFGDLVHSLKVSSKRMGIGDLKTCVLEGNSWRMFFQEHAAGHYFFCTDKSYEEEAFTELVEKVSTAAKCTSGATS